LWEYLGIVVWDRTNAKASFIHANAAFCSFAGEPNAYGACPPPPGDATVENWIFVFAKVCTKGIHRR
jgi:hypothetical protein